MNLVWVRDLAYLIIMGLSVAASMRMMTMAMTMMMIILIR